RVGTDGRAGVEGGLDAFSKTLAETHVEGMVGRAGGVEAAGGSAEGRIVGAVAVGGTRMAVGRRAWPECVGEAGRSRGRRADAGGGERLLDGADDQAANEARIAEADVRLGRMDVDVDQCGVERQEKH